MVERIEMKYIIKRGKTYYLNLRKPEDLREHFSGRSDFITKSLRTRDASEALSRRDEMLREYEKQFEDLRADPDAAGPKSSSDFDLEGFAKDFDRKVMKAARDMVERCSAALTYGEKLFDRYELVNSLSRLGEILSEDKLVEASLTEVALDDLWLGGKATVLEACVAETGRDDLNGVELGRAARQMIKSYIKGFIYVIEQLDREQGIDPDIEERFKAIVEEPPPQIPQVAVQDMNTGSGRVQDLEVIMEKCLDAKERAVNTATDIRTETMLFLEYIGRKPVCEYDIDDIELYVKALQVVPVRATRRKETRDLPTMRERIAKGQELGLEVLSPR